ncbi:MAG: insulinase family protein [Propionibacteriaceae bacterium]|nr:insulinase family protein [Propionibacteriaceae bacterium]
MTVWAYHLPGQHIVSCVLVLDLPLNCEPVDRDGIATVVTRLLDGGTQTHPSVSYAEALAEHGIHFEPAVGQSTTQLMIDLPADSLLPGLSLLAEAVKEPVFESNDFLSIQAQVFAEIQRQNSRGSTLASIALRWALLDHNVRISRPTAGNLESIPLITREDVCDFHKQHYSPAGATLIICGDIDPQEASRMASQAFEQWNTAVIPTSVEPIRRGGFPSHVITREDSVQADIRMGWFGIDQNDPRWASLQVATTIMGGSFGSRLNTVLREDRGFTYGVSMSAHPFRQGGYIDVVTSTQTATVKDLLDETREILAASQPFTATEVETAIRYLTLSAPLAFGTAEAVADQASSLAAGQLPLDHITTILSDLACVTVDSAMDAYRELINCAPFSTIVVGGAEISDDVLAS